MSNSNSLFLIETGTAVHGRADSPAAHANPILLGIVTATDNHSSDELFFSGAYTFEYGNEAALGGGFNKGANR